MPFIHRLVRRHEVTSPIKLVQFSERLDEWLRYLGWSLQELARETEIDRTVIWKWRVGRGQPRFHNADTVLDRLGLSLHEFFGSTPQERLLAERDRVVGAGTGLDGWRLEPGDLLCALNRAPRSALVEGDRGPTLAELVEPGAPERLVSTPLGPLDAYPLVRREGRRRVVLLGLSDLAQGLQGHDFDSGDVEALKFACQALEQSGGG